jgi:hypothetical protein
VRPLPFVPASDIFVTLRNHFFTYFLGAFGLRLSCRDSATEAAQ